MRNRPQGFGLEEILKVDFALS